MRHLSWARRDRCDRCDGERLRQKHLFIKAGNWIEIFYKVPFVSFSECVGAAVGVFPISRLLVAAYY